MWTGRIASSFGILVHTVRMVEHAQQWIVSYLCVDLESQSALNFFVSESRIRFMDDEVRRRVLIAGFF